MMLNRPGTKIYDDQYFKERSAIDWPIVKTITLLAKKNNYQKILEVGAGTGWLLNQLKKAGFKTEGCDISPISAKNPNITLASATKLPYKNSSFDLLVAISLIEHLNKSEVKLFLKETQRVLKEGGLTFLVTPNFQSPNRYLKGKNWFGYQDPTHIYFYTIKTLSELLIKNNFKKINFTHQIPYYPTIDFPLPFIKNKLPNAVNHIVNYLLISTRLALLRDSLWVSAQK